MGKGEEGSFLRWRQPPRVTPEARCGGGWGASERHPAAAMAAARAAARARAAPRWRERCRRVRRGRALWRAGTAAIGPSFPPTTAVGSDAWSAFGRAASGEWDGALVAFDALSGAPLPLPDRLVPEAFREWGEALYDRQAESHVLADDERLELRTRLVDPVAGCEEDAVSFEEELRDVLRGATEDKTILPSGAFSAGCRVLPRAGDEFLLECAVPLARGDERLRYRHYIRERAGGEQPAVRLQVIAERRVGEHHTAMGLSQPLPPSTCAGSYPEWGKGGIVRCAEEEADRNDSEGPSPRAFLDGPGVTERACVVLGEGPGGQTVNDLGEPWLALDASRSFDSTSLPPLVPLLAGAFGAYHAASATADGSLVVVAGHRDGCIVRAYDSNGRLDYVQLAQRS